MIRKIKLVYAFISIICLYINTQAIQWILLSYTPKKRKKKKEFGNLEDFQGHVHWCIKCNDKYTQCTCNSTFLQIYHWSFGIFHIVSFEFIVISYNLAIFCIKYINSAETHE